MTQSITLTASMRSNLASLKGIQGQMDTTQTRLSTGKKVNSAIDNASSFYQSRALTNRAADLDSLLDAMGQGIQTIQAANEGIEAITSYVDQAKSVADSAAALDPSTNGYTIQIANYQAQFEAIVDQIADLASDASYQGVNLLKGNTLKVVFNEGRTHEMSITGNDVVSKMGEKGFTKPTTAWNAAAAFVADAEGGAYRDITGAKTAANEDGSAYKTTATAVSGDKYKWDEGTSKFVVDNENGDSYKFTGVKADGTTAEIYGTAVGATKYSMDNTASRISSVLKGVADATSYLRDYSAELGNNFAIIETRQNFTEALIDVLETGADNLVLADMNEESANYLALQTRQQLAINSLALASQSAQSVLKLF